MAKQHLTMFIFSAQEKGNGKLQQILESELLELDLRIRLDTKGCPLLLALCTLRKQALVFSVNLRQGE